MTGDQILENTIREVFVPLYQLVIAAGIIYFLFGAVIFIANLDDPEKKKKGQQHLLWGLIGLFIIFSIGGILKFMNQALGGMFGN